MLEIMKIYMKNENDVVYRDNLTFGKIPIVGDDLEKFIKDLDLKYQIYKYNGDMTITADPYTIFICYKNIIIAEYAYDISRNPLSLMLLGSFVDIISEKNSILIDQFSFRIKEKNLRAKVVEFIQYLSWDKNLSMHWMLEKMFEENGSLKLTTRLISDLIVNPKLFLQNKTGNLLVYSCIHKHKYMKDIVSNNHLLENEVVKTTIQAYKNIYRLDNYIGSVSTQIEDNILVVKYLDKEIIKNKRRYNESNLSLINRSLDEYIMNMDFQLLNLENDKLSSFDNDILVYNRYVKNENFYSE